MSRTEVRADMELRVGDRVWARIYDWADRRFDTDAVLFTVLRYPEDNRLSEVRDRGYYLVTEHWRSAASRELFARRYLDREEREAFEAQGPRNRRGWLLGRIAAKDAVRDWLWRRGSGPLFPIEIAVRSEESGRPVVSGPFTDDLRVSLAHKDDVAVARVAIGHEVGIDIERVEPRGDGFAAIAFTESERALRSDAERDEWLTRVWAAKEAYAKAIGTGLEGNPRRFEVREVAGERLLVGLRRRAGEKPGPEEPRWVETCRDGEYVVAWTL
jgi:phosphopantetheinyl transferase